MSQKKPYIQRWPFNFGAIKNQDLDKAKVIIVPVPYDVTTSWRGGTREGPRAIISASLQLDELFYKNSNSYPIFTQEEVELSAGGGDEAERALEKIVGSIINKGKIPFLLGGEHSISSGPVKALNKKYSNLSVLQLDAHPDLLDEYVGSKYAHACVMRRIWDLKIPIVQVGIRSIDPETRAFIRKEKLGDSIFEAPEIPKEKILEKLTDNVYLTVDLDALDPSIMPSVGTPQPGGLGWYEVLDLIETVAKDKRIVGADVVELCPIPGFVAPDFLAAKLVYKISDFIINK